VKHAESEVGRKQGCTVRPNCSKGRGDGLKLVLRHSTSPSKVGVGPNGTPLALQQGRYPFEDGRFAGDSAAVKLGHVRTDAR
jgi:hypothetical protein